MSMMRKNSFFPVVKGMHSDAFLFGPTFTICLKCILDNIPEFGEINPGWKSIFFLKSDRNPLSGIQSSKVTYDN